MASTLDFGHKVFADFPDIYTPEVLRALEALAPLDLRRRELMVQRTARRKRRHERGERIGFLDPTTVIRYPDHRRGCASGTSMAR